MIELKLIRQGKSSFWKMLRYQLIVIHALMMREIITRYGRHNLGFAWMFAEPMMFTTGIVIIWSFSKEIGGVHHITPASFAITGYTTILIWRNVISRCVCALEPNKSLLYHRAVTPFDVFVSRIALEVGGITIAAIALFTLFISLGYIDQPADIGKMLLGWALLCWYAGAMGLLIGSLSEYSELVEKVWHPLAYFQLPISGAMAMMSWLPKKMQHVIMFFPVPHCVELYRSGYYGALVQPHYNIPYVILVCSVLTWLGLLASKHAFKWAE